MSTLRDILGTQGVLADRFPGYKVRAGQVAFAKAVEKVIAATTPPAPSDDQDGGWDDDPEDLPESEPAQVLVAECPTGTGKSIAYLVPAIQAAVAQGRQIVVATANIALQEQLINKDLPMLRDMMPEKFSFTLMKGIGNYLCLSKLANEGEQDAAVKRDRVSATRLRQWADETQTGDKSELDFDPESLWQHFAVGSQDCKGAKCKYAKNKTCHGKTARRKAMHSTVIVCNYHILLTHLMLLAKIGKNVILPELDVVILDECHKLADIARDFVGQRITRGMVRKHSRLLSDIGEGDLRMELDSSADEFFRTCYDYRRSRQYKARLRTKDAVAWAQIFEYLREGSVALLKAATTWPPERLREMGEDFGLDLRKASLRLEELAQGVKHVMTLGGEKDANEVFCIEETRGHWAELKTLPIEVGPYLRATLFAWSKAVVCTSATVAVNTRFDHYQKECGIDDATTLIAANPFDYWEQCKLVVPDNMPDPQRDRDAYRVAVGTTLADIVKRAKGRTLALFTSYAGIQEAKAALRDCPYQVLAQGDDQRMRLVAKFKEDIHSVLLGTESFWAGMDVPGEALSCVVIDRLPFAPPSDPLIDAIQEKDPDGWFQKAVIPRSILKVKQGAGRLIRSVDDRGVIVILDRRVTTKSYGRQYLRSLPRMPLETDLAAIDRMLP